MLGANEAVDAAACRLDEVVALGCEVTPDGVSLNIIPVTVICAASVVHFAPDLTIRDP